jgi:acetyl esterase/lipase
MSAAKGGVIVLLSFSLVGLELRGVERASAQVTKLPPAVRAVLKETGPRWNEDYDNNIKRNREAFEPVLERASKHGVVVTRNISYGPDPRNQLDIFQSPKLRYGRPILLFVHGGAYVSGDRNVTSNAFSNIGYFFAGHDFLAATMSYRLAPTAQWPSGAEDVAAAVKWLRANGARYGGDPNRIYLMGQSAGATHAASYVMMPSLHPATGPGVAGLILLSGRYRIEATSGPRLGQVQAYFGADPSLYPARSVINYVTVAPRVPTFIVIAEFDALGLDVMGADLFAALCARDGKCPRFLRMVGHTHSSEVLHFNTGDEALGREIIDFVNR